MKKLISFAFVLGLMLITTISARAEGMELKSVETIIAEIRQDQNIGSNVQIDIAKVTSAQLEELGDSVMEKVVGNISVHERLDIAFGGDGSASLTAVHIRVGYNYLVGIPITMMTFMGAGGMMGGFGYTNQIGSYQGFGGMMGGYGYYNQFGTLPGYGGMMGGFGWVWMIIGLLGLITFIVAVVYHATRSSKHLSIYSEDSALKVLKERYARGEITREEYSRMLEVLK